MERFLKRSAGRFLAAAALTAMVSLAASNTVAAEEEEEVAIKDLPTAVAKAIDDLFPGALSKGTFGEYMTRDRWHRILNFLRFSLPGTQGSQENRTAKVSMLFKFDLLNTKFLKYFIHQVIPLAVYVLRLVAT